MNLLEKSAKPKSETFDFNASAGAMQGASGISVSGDMLASKQLESILSRDNPLFTKARARAGAASARRGLLNSSIGVEAGESAMIDVAAPLAQSDAATNYNAAQFSAQAANDFARDANNFGRQGAMERFRGLLSEESQGREQTWRSSESALDRTQQTNERIGTQAFQSGESLLDRNFRRDERIGSQQYGTSEREASQRFNTGERIAGQAWQSGETSLDRGFRAGESALDRAARIAEQTNDQQFRRGESALDRGLTQSENALGRQFQTNERVSTQTYQSGENALQRAFQSGERVADQDFRAVQATLDRTQQMRIQELQEGGMNARQAQQIAAQERENAASRVFTSEQNAVDRQFRGEQAGLDRTFNREENQAGRAFQREERVGAQDFQGSQNLLERNFRGEQAGLDRAQQTTENAANRTFQRDERVADQNFRGTQADIDRAARVKEVQTTQEFQAKQQELSNKFAMDFEKFRIPLNAQSGFMERMQGAIGNIMADPNLTPEAKDGAIQNYYSYANQTMGWMSTFYGTEAAPKFPTGGAAGAPGTAPAGPSLSNAQLTKNRQLGLPDDFDPVAYMRANPDVAAANRKDGLTAEDHYLQWGRNEARREGTWRSAPAPAPAPYAPPTSQAPVANDSAGPNRSIPGNPNENQGEQTGDQYERFNRYQRQ